jgi:DNA polymerase-3 subunit delta'
VSGDEEADRIEGVRHPRAASALIGHSDHELALLDAYRAGRLPHAIILGGQPGIGKATLAWRLTRFILAHPIASTAAVREARDLAVPESAKVFGQIASLSHPDLSLLRRETNEKTKRFYTEIRADDVRRTIGLFQRAAGAGGYRVCIVDSAEDLNRSSANALLKLIEEPPPRSLFLLIAHRPGLVLPTIRSRARLVRMASLEAAEVEAVVETLGPPWSAQPAGDKVEAARLAKGSVHDALRLLGHRGIELGTMVSRLLERLPALDWREVHKLADQVSGRDGEAAYEMTLTTIYDWLAGAVRGGASTVPDAPRRLAPYAEVWEKVAANARETDALNLDKRPLILTIFSDLAAAVRTASAGVSG